MNGFAFSFRGGYVNFMDLFKQMDLEQALISHKGSAQYEAVFRYYNGCIDLQDSPQLLEPLGLLKQAIGALEDANRRRRAAEPEQPVSPDGAGAPDLADIYNRVEDFETRLHTSLEQQKLPATEVPKNLHFVWLGGGVGAIQRDYINIWKQVMAKEGYRLNVWYDSDGLLVHETNRIIVEAAKADVLSGEGQLITSGHDLADGYEERATALKRQMYMHINQATELGQSADQARMDLLVRGYGQDEVTLRALRDKNAQVMSSLNDEHIRLRDVHGLQAFSRLREFYNREMSLRGNLAAASDIVRVLVEHGEGGIYSDVDFLPPLAQNMAGIDVGKLEFDARLGILQLLLDHNPHWMPGRQTLRNRYTDYSKRIPAVHREALERFARNAPSLEQVFVPFADRYVQPDSLRLAMIDNGESNALIISHPGSTALEAIIERFEIHQRVLLAVELEADKRKIKYYDDDGMYELTKEVLRNEFDIFDIKAGSMDFRASDLCRGIGDYFSDGIRPGAQGSIFLTGPGAVRAGLLDFESKFLTPGGADAFRNAVRLNAGFNNATEEDRDHSWKENAENADVWLEAEKKRWTDGELKVRYTGNMAELLKHQSIDFEEGWPVIEGRHVLSTDLLQHLADELGEPFMRMMNRGHNGTVTFDRVVPLSFDERQSILAQSIDALPPASLSDPQTQQLSIDELLSRLTKGTVDVGQLSPLQRLLLGALTGAQTLDNRSFDAVLPQLDNLANSLTELGTAGRYATIERALYQRQAPAFLAGLASPADHSPAHSETALGLKKNALEQPLTLRQWGKQVGRIQQLAKLEYRDRIVERVGDVLDSFEAGTIKLVPQDLLLQGAGDPVGGRCYPLTLVMAAALSEGKVAANTLRERFYLGIIEPQGSYSASFLNSLEALRGVQLSEVGSALARSDLNQVVHILQARTATSTLMLNSDNHSMLVAKTIDGERSTYHFYDPNFGVFEFEDSTLFRQALEQFFLGQEMARVYTAYGDATHPTFDLIELDGARVRGVVLPGGTRVSQLLQPGTLPEQLQRPVRQRLASARGQSLTNNSRLGSCLLQLDSHWLGQQIEQATALLKQNNQLAPELVPLFETLEITPSGDYRLTLIDPKVPEHPVRVTTDDQRFLRIKNSLSETFAALATKSQRPVNEMEPTEAGSIHTLNAGFTIQALMNALRGQEGAGEPLTTAVRLHAYLNYAQLLHGNAVDVVGLVKLVRQALAEDKVIARTCAPVVSEALEHIANEGVGTVLGLANVGFDIYELANAENQEQRARVTTQLTFDLGGLAMNGVGFLAGGTAGAFAGALAVPLVGVGFGVTAIASNLGKIQDQARAIAETFNKFKIAYSPQACTRERGIVSIMPQSIVHTLDLRSGVIEFGSQALFRSSRPSNLHLPESDGKRAQAIDIRKSMRLPSRVKLPTFEQELDSDSGVVPEHGWLLPCTPKCYYGYEYQLGSVPTIPLYGHWVVEGLKGFALGSELMPEKPDPVFDVLRSLEYDAKGNQQFYLSAHTPFPFILYKLYPVYEATTVTVRLDSTMRSLYVADIPKPWHDMITYRIEGAGAPCTLFLNPGVSLKLESPSLQSMQWMLVATWASESDVRVGRFGELDIGTIKVERMGTGRHELLIKIADNQVFRVEYAKQQLTLVEQDVPQGMHARALQDHFKALAHEHRLGMPYTPVHQYLIPFERPDEPRYTTAWYDATEDRFLYIRDEDVLLADEALLGAVVNGYAYFYHPKSFEIWQVDAITGLLSHRYRLLLPIKADIAITSFVADVHGVIQLVQEITRTDRPIETMTYLIQDGQLFLSTVTHVKRPDLETVFEASDTLADWVQVLGDFYKFSPLPGADVSVDWQLAPFVSICWRQDDFSNWDMAWVRTSDRLIIRPSPRSDHDTGWPPTLKPLSGLTLIAPAGSESEVFVIYDKPDNRLCRHQRSSMAGKNQWSVELINPEGLANVVALQQGYLALTDTGLFFQVTAQGHLQLGGLTEDWLKNRVHWWLALDAVARQYPVARFSIAGLTSFSSDARLSAWYVDDRLLLADPGPGKDVRLLCVTPDNRAVWLFDVSNGQIYRQAFIDPQKLEGAFGQGSRLLLADALPPAEREWANWQFTDVTVEGAGLRGITFEGVVVTLHYQEPALVIGVTREWVVTQNARMPEALKQLTDSQPHTALLSVEEPGSWMWFVAETKRVIRVPKAAIPEPFELLGTQRQTNVLLHEDKEGLLLTYPNMGHAGPLSYVQRSAEVMVVEGHMKVDDVLPLMPDDVTTLILRMGQGAVSYRLSKTAWLKLESVIVDCRYSLDHPPSVPGKLIWDIVVADQLWVNRVDEHLVIVDSDSGHSLIFRQVFALDPVLRGDVFLSLGGVQSFAVSTLVDALLAGKDPLNSVLLKKLFPVGKVEAVGI
ncbi:TcdA/TcdB pore-forming domain-containing protein [Pseudomonas sp. S2_A02]